MRMSGWAWLGVALLAAGGGVFVWRAVEAPPPPTPGGPPIPPMDRLDPWQVVASIVLLVGAAVLGAALHRGDAAGSGP